VESQVHKSRPETTNVDSGYVVDVVEDEERPFPGTEQVRDQRHQGAEIGTGGKRCSYFFNVSTDALPQTCLSKQLAQDRTQDNGQHMISSGLSWKVTRSQQKCHYGCITFTVSEAKMKAVREGGCKSGLGNGEPRRSGMLLSLTHLSAARGATAEQRPLRVRVWSF
jgi:hypothetical protein